MSENRKNTSEKSLGSHIGPKEFSKAVALTYNGSGAPRITAKGTGELAQKIIEIAEAEGIPIQKNVNLVDALLQIDLNDAIPPQLYTAVAEILALIYKLDQRKQRKSR